MRAFVDALEGLEYQLMELKGFATIVPKVIQEDRERRWAEIDSRPSDGEEETIDVYTRESGNEEGGGFAPFGPLAISTSLAIGWELFHEFLAGELIRHLSAWLRGADERVGPLRDDEKARIEQDFGQLRRHYKQMLGLPLEEGSVPGWAEVENIRLVRHAIIHNQGLYTEKYAARPTALRADPEQGFGVAREPEGWVDRQPIPLDTTYVRESLDLLLETARFVRQKLNES